MDQKIKKFDRSIEQMMNEHQVAPPFGMWNRISSELEVMPVAAAAAPVATSLIPKRAMAGIIAATLIMGTTIITGYLVNSTINKNKTDLNQGVAGTQIATTVKPAVANTPVQQTIGVKKDIVAPVHTKAKPGANHSNTNQAAATLKLAQTITPTINSQPGVVQCITTPVSINTAVLSNDKTEVTEPATPKEQATETQTYYFPPIDIATTQKKTTAVETPAAKNQPVASNDDKDDKSSKISSGGDYKFRFRPHRRRKFTYGSIIR